MVIPTYNRAAYLPQAIDSALAQTCGDPEVIVVDDSSTDDTVSVIASYGSKIKYIAQDNKERGAARNNGIKNSSGEYIALLDSDDAWSPDHLESCLRALNSREGNGVAYSGSYLMGEDGNIIEKLPARDFHDHPLREIVAEFSSRGCNASSCLIKRDALERAGYFSEVRELSGSEDWEMWARIAAHSKLVFSGRYTSKIRFHPGKSSIDPARMARSMKLAMDTVFANEKLLPEISDLKARAYSSLCAVIAVNYYAAGEMKEARRRLAMALGSYPRSLVLNPLVAYTYLRTLFGRNLSSAMRRAKWGFGERVNR